MEYYPDKARSARPLEPHEYKPDHPGFRPLETWDADGTLDYTMTTDYTTTDYGAAEDYGTEAGYGVAADSRTVVGHTTTDYLM